MASPRLLIGRHSRIGAYYLITTVLHRRRPLFQSPALARQAIDELRRLESNGQVRTIAWVLMPDHLHWLLQLETDSLSRCMQAYKSRTARGVNTLCGGSGPVWQTGFHDHQLRSEEDWFASARYVVENPVRAGLVERIEDYPHWWCAWIASSADL